MSVTLFFRTKFWLWAAVTAILILAAGYIPIVKSGEEKFGYWGCWGVVLRGGSFVGTPADSGMILIFEGAKWGVILLALGWAVHRGLLAVLFRGISSHATVLNSPPSHASGQHTQRRRVIAAVVIGVAVAAPFVSCGLSWLGTPPRPKAELRYREGVSFVYGEVAWWFAPDVNNPGPCPLTVHLPGVDLDGAALALPDQLRGLGWEVSVVHREDDGRVYSVKACTPGRAVECIYIRGRLAIVRVGMSTVPVADDPPPESVAVSFSGKRVSLPSSNEAIIAALGPPLAER